MTCFATQFKEKNVSVVRVQTVWCASNLICPLTNSHHILNPLLVTRNYWIIWELLAKNTNCCFMFCRQVTGAFTETIPPPEEEQEDRRVRRRMIVLMLTLMEVDLKTRSLLHIQREYNSFMDCKKIIKLLTRNHVIL